MSMAATAEVKGWCPGALRPMPSGDGLIVRVRPHCGALALGQVQALAALAERLGNGHIDLTRRANLQLRGLEEALLPELHAALAHLDLVDVDADVERVRNVMVAPLAGLDPGGTVDVRAIASQIERSLIEEPRLRALPAKFGLLVDGGGPASIAGERADVCLYATDAGVAVGLDTPGGTQWLGTVGPEAAGTVAVAAIHAFLDETPRRRMRDLPREDHARLRSRLLPRMTGLGPIAPPVGRRPVGLLRRVVGIAAPFGRLEAAQLHGLAVLAEAAGAGELRLSPWRTLYGAVWDEAAGRALLEGARALGLIVEADDPLLRIEACPGAPACRSSSVDTRGDARRLAALDAMRRFRGVVHVSGCAKGCARSAASEIVLVGRSGLYRLARNATTRGPVERLVHPADLPTIVEGTVDG